MTSAVEAPVRTAELLVEAAELLVVDDGLELAGGRPADSGGRVTGAGEAGMNRVAAP
ncbi:hypothetical protein ACHBTE_12180 [Streptomyces sp. M41]|uniref:hypothetical protein n=1 Tax=Streptomyces sp. M41 TaxID=3059412 RepID=UPI00374D9942